MKCPHCNYMHGEWHNKKEVVGEHGNFFSHPVKMERVTDWEDQRTTIYACPSCGKLFIEV